MKLGFIGTGAITEAIVTGLLAENAGEDRAIIVSPRNAATAARLADRFARTVRVASSNQDVVDAAETVVIAVRPPMVREVLAPLAFRADQIVISLVATLGADAIAPLVAPATRIVRAIPLPSAADRASPTAVMPPDPAVKALFDRIGAAVETADPRAFDAMSAVSGVMAGQFAAAGAVADWLADKGAGQADAETYVRLLFAGLAGTARRSGASFDTLARGHTTEGGLNAQFLAHLRDCDLDGIVRSGLDRLLARIEADGRTP